MKFLIDECLSPELAKLALEKGHGETSHVVWMKLAGLKDWELKPGVELVQDSFDETDIIRSAMKDAYGVFSVLPANLSAEAEVRHGVLIADIAAETGIKHFVYSSGASVGNELTCVPRFDAKPRIDAHVRALAMTATIIRPMIFMEMLVRPGFRLDEGRLVSLILPDHSIQLTAVEDIGRFVADKLRFGGTTLKVASDRLTGRELAGFAVLVSSLWSNSTARLVSVSRTRPVTARSSHDTSATSRLVTPRTLSRSGWNTSSPLCVMERFRPRATSSFAMRSSTTVISLPGTTTRVPAIAWANPSAVS